jgi:hypothetical protein
MLGDLDMATGTKVPEIAQTFSEQQAFHPLAEIG